MERWPRCWANKLRPGKIAEVLNQRDEAGKGKEKGTGLRMDWEKGWAGVATWDWAGAPLGMWVGLDSDRGLRDCPRGGANWLGLGCE